MAPNIEGFLNCLRIVVRSWPISTDLFFGCNISSLFHSSKTIYILGIK